MRQNRWMIVKQWEMYKPHNETSSSPSILELSSIFSGGGEGGLGPTLSHYQYVFMEKEFWGLAIMTKNLIKGLSPLLSLLSKKEEKHGEMNEGNSKNGEPQDEK